MVHCGYEPSAVDYTFSGLGGIWANVKAILSPLYPDEVAAKRLAEEAKKPHRPIERLVQLGIAKDVEKTAA
jgi:hypothetical protein